MIDLGQVFTKNCVAKYMVSLFNLPKQSSILDPCCGTGAFLDALLNDNYVKVTACEIDVNLFHKTKQKYHKYRIVNTDFLKYGNSNEYDGIIMNPPYIRHEKIDDLKSYGITKQIIRSNPIFAYLPSAANMYMYFILRAIDLLKKSGQLIVIFPSSWINTRIGSEFKKIILSKCGVEKQIYICGDVFEREAMVEVVILKLVKGETRLNTDEEYLEFNGGLLHRPMLTDCGAFNEFSYPFFKLATVRRGLTTGYNKMYINPGGLHNKNARCLKPIISSPKNIDGYTTLDARLDFLFSPMENSLSNEEIDYLNFWKNKIIKDQKPKTLYEKINNNDKWYEIHEVCSEGILFSYFVRNDMKFIMNETGMLVRDNFYIIKPKINKWVMFALLNNYYTYYQLESRGKKYGAGLLKLQKYDIEDLYFPDYNSISYSDRNEMVVLSHALLKEADIAVIREITKLVSKYCSTSGEEIEEKYVAIKMNRFGVKSNDYKRG